MDGIDDGSGVLDADSLADTVLSVDPSGVDEPNIGLVLLDLLLKHFCIDIWMSDQEGLTETSREGRGDSVLTGNNSGHLGSVATDEVVHSLGAVKLGDWRKDTVCIRGQEDDVLWMTSDCRDLSVRNELKWVSASGVLSN